MATVVLYSVAYRGDVLPMAPVAWELARRGHTVRFVCPAELHPLVARHGVTPHPADEGDLSPTGLDRHGAFVERWGTRLGGVGMVKLFIRDLCATRLVPLAAAVDAVLDGADLLVAHPAAALVGRLAAEPRRVPWAVADMLPGLVPTGDRPPDGVGLPRRWPAFNRAVWRLAGRVASAIGDERSFRAERTRRGLATPPRYVFEGRVSPLLHLGLASPHYYPAPSDLPSYRACGFTSWTTSADELPADVAAFLDAGDPPVVVTLGTSAASAADGVFAQAAAALDRLGLRGLFLTGTAAHGAALAGRPGVWPFVPLGPVLPRARAVLHSGSHGTNALVLEAGVPSVVVPLLFDQVWHGARNRSLGIGTMVRRPSVDRLTAALGAVTSDGAVQARSRVFADLLSVEDGAGRAADEIEGVLAG